jgi:hypothetical protein
MDTPAAKALRQLLQRDGTIGGTSAGAAMMCDPMICGGSSAGAMRYGAHYQVTQPIDALKPRPESQPAASQVDEEESRQPGVRIGRGMGFFNGNMLLDQHFIRRGRLGRLILALLEMSNHGWWRPKPPPFGQAGYAPPQALGIDEDAALVVDVRGEREVIGECGATLILAGPSGVSIRGIDGVQISVFGPGRLLYGGDDQVVEFHQAGFRRLDGGPWDRDQLKKVVAALQEVKRVYIADDDVELCFGINDETRFWRNERGSLNVSGIRLDISFNLAHKVPAEFRNLTKSAAE